MDVPTLRRRTWMVPLLVLGGWLLLDPQGGPPVPYRQILDHSRQSMIRATRILAALPVPANPVQTHLATLRLRQVAGSLNQAKQVLAQTGLAASPPGKATYQAVGRTLQLARSALSASPGLERILQSAEMFDHSPSAASARKALGTLGPLPRGKSPLITAERQVALDWRALLHLYAGTPSPPSAATRSRLKLALGKFTTDLSALSTLWRSPDRW